MPLCSDLFSRHRLTTTGLNHGSAGWTSASHRGSGLVARGGLVVRSSLVVRGGLGRAMRCFEDWVVAEAFTLRSFAIVARGVSLIALLYRVEYVSAVWLQQHGREYGTQRREKCSGRGMKLDWKENFASRSMS